MRVIVASTTVPHIDGGGRLIVTWAADAIRQAGHEVEEFYFPFPPGAGATAAALVGLRHMPLADECDRLITIRWPAHVVQHANKAAWFIHHYRQVFDLWDTPYRNVPDNADGVAFREMLRSADNLALRECADIFSNSTVVRNRLRVYNNLEAEVLYPPLGGDTARFRTEGYGDFILYPSRVTTIKRQMLAIQALNFTRTPVRLIIAGKPESDAYLEELIAARSALPYPERCELRMGWMPEDEKVQLLAECRAIAYLPADEDSYGYPSLEASHSRKAIVTLTDAGGALEFVRDGVEGLVSEPTPRALAAAFDRMYDDPSGAAAMGQRSSERRFELGIEWPRVVAKLLGQRP